MERIQGNPEVCVYDSGIGGINLLIECVIMLPQVDFIYYGDNYRVPYGRFSHEELIAVADEKFREISLVNPSAAVVACNTVTSQCIDYLRKNYPFKIVGIQPAIKPAASFGGECLVLATQSTANSDSLRRLTEKYGGGHTKIAACPELASYIENNIFDISAEEVERLLPKTKADSVVLGCTHYIFAKDIIHKFYSCPVFDGIEGTAERLREILGISDHRPVRAQKIQFRGGNFEKNRRVFQLFLSRRMEINP